MVAANAIRRPRKKGFWTRMVDFKVEDIFRKKPLPPRARTIYINEDLPPDAFNKGKVRQEWVFPTNQVVTSKYTPITFLPRNLFEQFRRVANIFFFGIAVLQFFSVFSTISPGLVILPLLAVLLITALKDGYEDIKRHQSDRAINHSHVYRLEGGGWVNPNATGEKAKQYSLGFPFKFSRSSQKVQLGMDEIKVEKAPEGGPPMLIVPDHNGLDGEPDSNRYLQSHDEKEAHWKRTLWEDVRVGDVLMMRSDDAIPADLLICSTSEEENVCFIETKNLDGETNLKSRNGIAALSHLRTPNDLAAAPFQVHMEPPVANMFQLNGAVVFGANGSDEQKQPVDIVNVLLRGTVMRNTRWAVGIVLATGEDTKIVLNSGRTPSKRSKVERQMNPQVMANLLLLAVMAVVCAVVDSILERRGHNRGAPWEFATSSKGDNPNINGLITFGNALITFQNVIPISLYISIEFVRTCQAAFIYFDREIYYEKTDQPTLARSWNLSDDLGQIEYVFSDKTGTLTQNVMIFRQCSVGGKIYKGDPDHVDENLEGEGQESGGTGLTEVPTAGTESSSSTAASASNPKVSAHVKFVDTTLQNDLLGGSSPEHARSLNGFFNVLALCHTVLASQDPDTGIITYKAQSPDEAALVQAAADVGFIFRGRDRDILKLQTPFADHLEEYELLNVLDFTSERKRMSVIVKKLEEGDSRIFLLCKGADNVIFERVKPGPGSDELKAKTGDDLDAFSSEGLRTLCLAYKVISEEEYASWAERYHEATVLLENRDQEIAKVSDEIEQNLRLLGSTAIEDKLQDGVPETIAELKRAGIKVWVLTGDKLETAIAIGQTTNLIAPSSNVIIVRGGEFGGEGKSAYDQMVGAVENFFPESGILDSPYVHPPESDKASQHRADRLSLRRMPTGASSLVGHDNGDRPGGFVLVIDGAALTHALVEEFTQEMLLQLGTRCEAVICCRVSPKQKAQVTSLVKEGLGVMTLAIGDGANDVSMIQAADIGVGISGEEGLQAVNASDYAIAQFRFLKRLLFVHGHWSYQRNGNMIVNFFYKNIVCIGVLWWFQIYCAWSTTYVFDYTYLLFWNVFWSLAPVIAIGLFDRVIDADILMTLPELYRYGREGRYFGLKLFLIYMWEGVFQSAVVFFFIYYAYTTTTSRNDGYSGYQFEFSTTMVIAAVLVVNLFNGLNTYAWTGWVWFAVYIGIILVWAYTGIYSLISPGWFHTWVYGNEHYLFHSADFWLGILLATPLALLPHYAIKAYKVLYHPDDLDVLRWLRKNHPEHDIAHDTQITGCLSKTQSMPFDDSRSMASSNFSDDDGIPRRSTQGGRPSMDGRDPRDPRQGSRTDMSTGARVPSSRGFDFSMEERGVAMQRVQSRLSERHQSRVSLPGLGEPSTKRRRGSIHLFPSLRKSIREKRFSGVPPVPTIPPEKVAGGPSNAPPTPPSPAR
ncbi:hypothetical protein FRB94_004792 [Tulasnella sp. JGI-2019a]|nr:hypothetical protein FRB94_004792 [Tulasnella sp. JGI-2019a]KAG9015393.1 hypothetical protein FRB93_013093 [Tulasnella sp. JGI-2019a]KAG9033357.1 hypothetical protein FRB95_014899 [Tulasnella sp. JGI-2019a]